MKLFYSIEDYLRKIKLLNKLHDKVKTILSSMY